MEHKNKWLRIGARARSFLIIGVALVITYVFLQNISVVLKFLQDVLSLLSPFLWGIALAYLLSLLMLWIEHKLFAKIKRKKLRRSFSLLLTIILSGAFITGFLFSVIPQLTASISSLVNSISAQIDNSEELVMGWVSDLGVSRDVISAVFGSWEEIIKTMTDWAKSLIPGIAAAGIRVGQGIIMGLVSVFVAIYILFDLENLLNSVRLVTIAVFGEKRYAKLEVVRKKCHKAFGGFLVGKIIDSAIIGVICFIFMFFFKMPYAPLISFIIGLTNIIPTFGPFIGAIPSLFIIFIVNPRQALIFGIFVFVLQQIDGNLIGPFILRDTVGLSALWILFAVVFFGSLWGVGGMVIGVPIFAVIYDLLREAVHKKLANLSFTHRSNDESHGRHNINYHSQSPAEDSGHLNNNPSGQSGDHNKNSPKAVQFIRKQLKKWFKSP